MDQILLNTNKTFDFTSKSLKKVIFVNDFIKKFVAKRITQSARKRNVTLIFNFTGLT